MAEDENGEKMHTLHHNGFHVIFSEPLTPEEDVVFKQFLDHVRADKKKKHRAALTHIEGEEPKP